MTGGSWGAWPGAQEDGCTDIQAAGFLPCAQRGLARLGSPLAPSLTPRSGGAPRPRAPCASSLRSFLRSFARPHVGTRCVRGTFVNSCAPSPQCLHGRRCARRAFAQSARTEHGAGARAPRTVAAGVGPGQQGQRQASLQPVRGVERTVLVTQGERRLPPPSRSPAASCARRLPLTAHAPEAPRASVSPFGSRVIQGRF